jgi:hypothetical protein
MAVTTTAITEVKRAPKKTTSDDLKVEEARSEDDSDWHSSDQEFLNDDTEEEEWQVDPEGILAAPAEKFAAGAGGTLGMKRFAAMIASIEQRALAAEARKKNKKTTKAAAKAA